MRVPVKTRLPVEAWVFAVLVTLFSLTSSIVQQPKTETKVQFATAADTLTSSFALLSSGISDLTAYSRRALSLGKDRG
ncbi:MAG: hypothetical protein ACRECX_02380 [Methyloceanibacter sp.]|uniref:hypothetical protein n=1 Tax=Methyloceanibacter sp. TaxID=1965321 RepID=UPI003D6CF738